MTATETETKTEFELRLALAMRGGVSLAVWIGGACAEIDRVRKLRSAEPFWARVLALSPYTSVAVDVIAGASAGGLNGAVYAAAQQYGFDLDEMRGIWLRLADLDTLMRSYDENDTPSLLDGDRRFLDPLDGELRRLVEESVKASTAPTERPPIDLQLAATLVEPVRYGAPSPVDERLQAQRFTARFHFSHQPVAAWIPSDFPCDPDGAVKAALSRLAVAARSTSSFPGAFEAALVRSRRPSRFGGGRNDRPGRLVDMRGVFSESQGAIPALDADATGDEADFVVSDGGILDNIPLGRAIQAIVAAPSDHRSARRLVYVQPGAIDRPAESGLSAGGLVYRRRSEAVLRGAIASRINAETINDDIADLERHNASIVRARTLRADVLGGITDDKPLLARAEEMFGLYPALRSSTDAQHLRALLDDPIGTLGSDPFPASGNVTDTRWRAPLSDLAAEVRESIDSRLATAFGETIDPGDLSVPAVSERLLTSGLGPMRRTLGLLLEWTRWLEDRYRAQAGDFGREKAKLYRLLLFTTSVLDRHRRVGWVCRAATSLDATTTRATLADWCRTSVKALDALLEDEAPDAIIEAVVTTSSPDVIAAFVESSNLRLNLLLSGQQQDAPRATAGGSDGQSQENSQRPVLSALLRRTVEIFTDLQRTAGQLRQATSPIDDEASEAGRLLDAAIGTGGEHAVVTLASLEVACLAEHLSGTPGGREIEFERMSAEARTPLARYLDALQKSARADAREKPGTATAPQSDVIPVKQKLAGNELGNFSAFLRSTWRANDWMWGRLDAVPTLVRLLATPQRLSNWLRGDSSDNLLAKFKSTFRTDDGEFEAFLTTVLWEVDPGATSADTDAGTRTFDAVLRAEIVALGTIAQPTEENVANLHRALVARRQWEIIREELGKQDADRPGSAGGGQPPSWGELVAILKAYDTGAQRVGGRDDAETLARAAALTGQTIRWHLGPARGKATPWWATWASSAVSKLTTLVIRLKLSGPKKAPGEGASRRASKGKAPRKIVAAIVALVAGIVGVIAWAAATDLPATIAAGAAIAALFVVLLAFVLARTRRPKPRRRPSTGA